MDRSCSVAPNPPVDSFYEYLWGGWALLGDRDCRDWYRLLTAALLRRTSDESGGALWFKQVNMHTGAAVSTTQDELAAFYAELLAQGGNRAEGERYYDSWTRVVERFGLPPEEIDYTTMEATDPGYALRPEYANSAFDLWLLTHDDRYRRTAYAHFVQLKRNCRVDGGYTVLSDVRTTPMTRGDLHARLLVRGEHEVPVPHVRAVAAFRRQARLSVDGRQDPARAAAAQPGALVRVVLVVDVERGRRAFRIRERERTGADVRAVGHVVGRSRRRRTSSA